MFCLVVSLSVRFLAIGEFLSFFYETALVAHQMFISSSCLDRVGLTNQASPGSFPLLSLASPPLSKGGQPHCGLHLITASPCRIAYCNTLRKAVNLTTPQNATPQTPNRTPETLVGGGSCSRRAAGLWLLPAERPCWCSSVTTLSIFC